MQILHGGCGDGICGNTKHIGFFVFLKPDATEERGLLRWNTFFRVVSSPPAARTHAGLHKCTHVYIILLYLHFRKLMTLQVKVPVLSLKMCFTLPRSSLSSLDLTCRRGGGY